MLLGRGIFEIKNTILFVAFDFEEYIPEYETSLSGSRDFVKNLTTYLANTKGTVNGALIMETIINHNCTQGKENGFVLGVRQRSVRHEKTSVLSMLSTKNNSSCN